MSTEIQVIQEVFNDFFTKDNVDFQNPYIIVHFPKLTVTNENDKSIDITHLFVRVNVAENGTLVGTFEVLRTEYTDIQFDAGYCHSHHKTVTCENFKRWDTTCLGSGPIKDTIASLNREYSEELWELFCFELYKYVRIESLEGVPYIRLEEVGNDRNYSKLEFPIAMHYPILKPDTYAYYEKEPLLTILNSFMDYIIDNRPFSFNFINGSYGIAMSPKELYIVLSNLFIDWFNSSSPINRNNYTVSDILRSNILVKGKKLKDGLYTQYRTTNPEGYKVLIGTEMLIFKGKPVLFNITESGEDANVSLFLDMDLFKLIIFKILMVVNYRYGHSNLSAVNSFRETYRFI
jgi:hypothetical protein